MLLAVCALMTAFSMPASALEYEFDAPSMGLFGRPTSDETIYVGVNDSANIDRSKSAALIPPTFGSPTSYTLNAGEYLTPNLVSGQTGSVSTSGITVAPPSIGGTTGIDSSTNGSYWTPAYTAVTEDLYYTAGHLGTLKIPAINLTVKVYQGTDSAALAKGAGHFSNTSIWNGNVAFAAHNRGVANHFGKIHTLSIGDKVNYFWGGKSLVMGWDSRWGTVQKVTADGSTSTGTYRPYGLDCSGFVDWVFYNATDGGYIIGHGGGAASQHTYCTAISWADALPGDLVFYPDDTHVGIVAGWDEDGNILIVHCASGYNNVVITGKDGFLSVGRPAIFR